MIFLVLIHIPLTKVSAAWSFCTCFLVWFIDSRTKETIFNVCRLFAHMFFSPTEACRMWRKSQKVYNLDTARGSISQGMMSKKDRLRFKNCVDWVCLNLFLFASVVLNFVYTTMLHDVVVQTTTYAIQFMDAAGFDAHFIRFVHMTMFEQDGVSSDQDVHSVTQLFDLVSLDLAMLALIILPMFLFAMHFYTAPFRKRYRNKRQILIVPLALVPPFFFTNIDILILSIIVLLQNGYIAWY